MHETEQWLCQIGSEVGHKYSTVYNPHELTDRLLQPGKTSVELAAELEAAQNNHNAEHLEWLQEELAFVKQLEWDGVSVDDHTLHNAQPTFDIWHFGALSCFQLWLGVVFGDGNFLTAAGFFDRCRCNPQPSVHWRSRLSWQSSGQCCGPY